MDKLIIKGPTTLQGTIQVSPAKNSTLKLLAATLLAPVPVILKQLPLLQDLKTMQKLLLNLGVEIAEIGNGDIKVDATKIKQTKAHYDIVKTMRASILVMGPLLTKYGHASVSLPGGCAIGARPIDIHLKGFEQLGATIEMSEGYVTARAERLKGAAIHLPFPSVGATENILMAAVFAYGETIIDNAAREPEIIDLANFLMNLFPTLTITGAGTQTIYIRGIERNVAANSNVQYLAIGDRIEAATFVMAALMTGSSLRIEGFNPQHLKTVLDLLEKMGAQFTYEADALEVHKHQGLKATQIDTAPYPGFPTDVQAQMMALMLTAHGTSMISENIFENRFMHVPELIRMGAKIILKGKVAIIEGGHSLHGAPVMCTDLRASAALVLCALVVNGTTEIQRVYHLDRGYAQLEKKLVAVGANIERIK